MSGSLSSGETSYDSLVLVEFTREGFYSIGLDTSQSPQPVSDVAGEPVRNIFLPRSPDPAGGRLVLVPESQVHQVDMSVRQGMDLIMTTGAASRGVDSVPPVADMSLEEAVASLEAFETDRTGLSEVEQSDETDSEPDDSTDESGESLMDECEETEEQK